MISVACFKVRARKEEREHNKVIIIPSDYTIFVKGIPKQLSLPGATLQEKLKNFFENKSKDIMKREYDIKHVNKVNLVYNIDKLIVLEKYKEKLIEKYR